MISELKQKESIVFTLFIIFIVLGPVLGILAGSKVSTKLGGYNSKKSLYLACMMATFCVFCAGSVSFVYNFALFMIVMWLLLFFGGFMLPTLTGMMLNTVEENLKTTANFIANLSYNILGFFPAPFVYGAICDIGDGGHERYAMRTLMFSSVISVVTLYISACLITKKTRQE